MTDTKTPGYKASKEQLLKRLARAEGQVRGVAGIFRKGEAVGSGGCDGIQWLQSTLSGSA